MSLRTADDRQFSGTAALDPRLDTGRVLLAVSGLYLPVVAGLLVARALGYARRQRWERTGTQWTCEERTSMLGIELSRRTLHVPASSVVYHSTGSLGDPALLLCGAFYLFGLVFFGVSSIHTGLLAASPVRIFLGGLLILSGLALDVGCFVLHQRLASRNALQIGLLDGRVHTIRDLTASDAG